MATTFNKMLNRNPAQAVPVFTVIMQKSLFLSRWKKARTLFEHLHSEICILFHNYEANPALAGSAGIRRSIAQCFPHHRDPADRIGFQQAHPREALQDMIKYYNPVCLNAFYMVLGILKTPSSYFKQYAIEGSSYQVGACHSLSLVVS